MTTSNDKWAPSIARLAELAGRARKAYDAMNEATVRMDDAEVVVLERALAAVAVALPAILHPVALPPMVAVPRFNGLQISTAGKEAKTRLLYLADPNGDQEPLLEVFAGAVMWVTPRTALEHGHDLAVILQNLANAVSKQVLAREVTAKARNTKASELESLEGMLTLMAKVAR